VFRLPLGDTKSLGLHWLPRRPTDAMDLRRVIRVATRNFTEFQAGLLPELRSED